MRELETGWRESERPSWLAERTGETEQESRDRRRSIWAHSRGWVEDEESFLAVGGDVNRVVSRGDGVTPHGLGR